MWIGYFFSHIARNYSTPGVCLCYFWKWFKQCVYSRCGRSEDKCLLCRRWCFPSQHQVSFHVQNYYKHVLCYLPKTWLQKMRTTLQIQKTFCKYSCFLVLFVVVVVVIIVWVFCLFYCELFNKVIMIECKP